MPRIPTGRDTPDGRGRGDHAPNGHTPSNPQRVAFSYARTAAANPLTIAEQHTRNRAFAASEGDHISDDAGSCFSDDGVSGHEVRTAPGFIALLAAVRAGGIAGGTRVYIRDVARLGRSADPHDGRTAAQALRDLGVAIWIEHDGRELVELRLDGPAASRRRR